MLVVRRILLVVCLAAVVVAVATSAFSSELLSIALVPLGMPFGLVPIQLVAEVIVALPGRPPDLAQLSPRAPPRS